MFKIIFIGHDEVTSAKGEKDFFEDKKLIEAL